MGLGERILSSDNHGEGRALPADAGQQGLRRLGVDEDKVGREETKQGQRHHLAGGHHDFAAGDAQPFHGFLQARGGIETEYASAHGFLPPDLSAADHAAKPVHLINPAGWRLFRGGAAGCARFPGFFDAFHQNFQFPFPRPTWL